MNLPQKHVAVIGAGVAGLTAADALAGWGMQVSLFEKTPFLGGHAIQLNCKATDACVKCGACVAEEKLRRVDRHANITIFSATEIEGLSGNQPFRLNYRCNSPQVNADRCNGCGICFQKCPVPGAILQGMAPRVGPYVAIRQDLCRFFENGGCSLCRDTCPQGVIHLDTGSRSGSIDADAILVATGFSPYNPSAKPYGYGLFPNVITSLDAERLLREKVRLLRPSDDKPARRMAFIQCVGSRDARLGHSWCSKICCGSSLRMARLIQSRQKDMEVTFFYIDIQTFGRDFACFQQQANKNISMIRAIPGEIARTDADELEVSYFDPQTQTSSEALFDVVVLSVGLTPSAGNKPLARLLDLTVDKSGFMPLGDNQRNSLPAGIFTAGSAGGPMGIAESVGSAEKSVYDLVRYLGIG